MKQETGVTKRFASYVSQNIFGMLGISCYIIADTFFIAQAAGANGITVLNLALPVYNLIFAIGAMIGVGAATRFAILRAQKDERAERYFSNAVFSAIAIGMLFVLAGIFFPDRILRLMGGDAEIVALGTGYTRIFLLFTPFFMLNHIISAFVRNDNAVSRAMFGTMIGNLANVILDYIFMFPMGLGLEGAALATAVSPIISIIICGTHFFTPKNTVKFLKKKPSFSVLCQSCQLGVSAMIGELSSGVTTTVFNYLILGIAGNIGVAAYGVIANFSLIAVAIFNGVAQGVQPLLSECYGRGKQREVKKLLRLGIGTAAGIALVLYGVVFLFTDELVAIFNSEKSQVLADYAFEGMRLYFAGFLFAGFNIVGAGYLSATANPGKAFLTSLIRGVIAITICAYILAQLWGMTGVWLSFACAEIITAVIMIFALREKRK